MVSVIDDWLLPSMVHLGKAWQRGRVSVAGEHFVTGAVHRRLALTFQSLPPAPSGGPRVVVGLARGSRHEIGVLAFALVLRSRGVAVTYLGGDLPLEAWVGAVRLIEPGAVVLAAPTIEDLPAVREATEALMPLTDGAARRRPPGPRRGSRAPRSPRRRGGRRAGHPARRRQLSMPGTRSRVLSGRSARSAHRCTRC